LLGPHKPADSQCAARHKIVSMRPRSPTKPCA